MSRFSPGFIFPGGNGPLVLTYKGEAHVNNAASATQTFTACAIGTASADRWVFVFIVSKNGTARTLNSVTIGGVTAQIEVPNGTHNQTNGLCTIAFALVPTGTTADIVLNWSGTFTVSIANGSGIDWYTVVGALNTTASDSLDDNSITSPITKVFSVPAGGIAIAGGNPNNVSRSITGDFTVDDNFIQAWGGGARGVASVSNADNTASANKTFTATAFSVSGALSPKIGRAYGHT